MKVVSVLLAFLLLVACKNKVGEAAHNSENLYYTCSMHPQIMLPAPGKCPICGMELIPVKNRKATDDKITLTDQQIMLSNISVDTIHNGMLGNQLILTATINFDQTKITTVSSRVMGRVEKLYFKDEGAYVKKGDKIYDLYSEDLNNAKKEYQLLIERKTSIDNSVIDFEQLLRSAKNKLLLWGLSVSQIQHLASSKEKERTTSIYSNADGYITSLDIKEGDYVMEGMAVLHLADLSSLWVEAQVYNSEFSKIEKDAIAEVRIEQRTFRGKIEFINSEVNTDSRVTLIRVTVANNDNKLKPGMPAYVVLKNPKHDMLSLPIDAVLRDGKGATVWLLTSKNTFENRMVEVGMETGDRIEIKSGLMDGDVVVLTGAYLINSEYIFKKGANPMSGMKM